MPQTMQQRNHLQQVQDQHWRDAKLRALDPDPRHTPPTRAAVYLLIPVAVVAAVALCVGLVEIGRWIWLVVR